MHILVSIMLILAVSKYQKAEAQQVDDAAPVVEAWVCDENLEPLGPNESKVNLMLGSKIRICIQPTFRTRNQRIVMRSIDRFSFSKGERGIDGVQAVIEDSEVVSSDQARVYCEPGATMCSFQAILMDDFFFPPIFDGDELPPRNTVIQGVGAVSMEYGSERLLRGTVDLHVSRRIQVGSLAGIDEFDVVDIPIAEQVRGDKIPEKDNAEYQDMWASLPRWAQALCVIAGILLLFLCCCCFAFGGWLAGTEGRSILKKKHVQPQAAEDGSGRTILNTIDGGVEEKAMSTSSTVGNPASHRSDSSNLNRSRHGTPRRQRRPSAARRPSDTSLAPGSEEFSLARGSSHGIPDRPSDTGTGTNPSTPRRSSHKNKILGNQSPHAPSRQQPLPIASDSRHTTSDQQPVVLRNNRLPVVKDDSEIPSHAKGQTRAPRRHSLSGDAGMHHNPNPTRLDKARQQQLGKHSAHGGARMNNSNPTPPAPARQLQLARHSVHGDAAAKNPNSARPSPAKQWQLERDSAHGGAGKNNTNPARPAQARQQQLGRHSAHGDAAINYPSLARPTLAKQQPLGRNSAHGDVAMNHSCLARSTLAKQQQQQQPGKSSTHGNVDPVANRGQPTRPTRRPSPEHGELTRRDSDISTSSASFAEEDEQEANELLSPPTSSHTGTAARRPSYSMPPIRIPMRRNSINGSVAPVVTKPNPKSPPKRRSSDITGTTTSKVEHDDEASVAASEAGSRSAVSPSNKAVPRKHPSKHAPKNPPKKLVPKTKTSTKPNPKSPAKRSTSDIIGTITKPNPQSTEKGSSSDTTGTATSKIDSDDEAIVSMSEAGNPSIASPSNKATPRKHAPKNPPKKLVPTTKKTTTSKFDSSSDQSSAAISASSEAAPLKKHPPTKNPTKHPPKRLSADVFKIGQKA